MPILKSCTVGGKSKTSRGCREYNEKITFLEREKIDFGGRIKHYCRV